MHASHQYFLHDVAEDICQAIIAAGVPIGQSLVIQAEQVQHRRVQIMQVNFTGDRAITEIVGCSMRESRLHAAAGHEPRETFRLMFPPMRFERCRSGKILAPGCATELPGPQHQRFVQ